MEGKAKVLSITIGIALLVTPYLIASFTLWDINPKNWSASVRWAVSAFGLMLSVFGMACTYNNK